jgi:hypothetical protein
MATNGLRLRRWAFLCGMGAIWANACTAKERDFSLLSTRGVAGAGGQEGEAGVESDGTAGALGDGGGEGAAGGTPQQGAAGAEPGGEPGTEPGVAGESGASERAGTAGTPPVTAGGQAGEAAPGPGGSGEEAGAPGAGVAGALSCGESETNCRGVCAELDTDAANCGFCGNDCGTGKTCSNKVCVCDDQHLNCAEVCIDPKTDEKNCGSCGTVCPQDRTCVAGKCNCTAPLVECEGRCVNPVSDLAHCGECGHRCVNGATCDDRVCTCPQGLDPCVVDGEDVCLDTSQDSRNCGGCAQPCGTNQVCTDGKCACTGGLELCDGECVNTDTDGAHCGSCNHTCTGSTYCVGGECVTDCLARVCGDSCVNTDTDILNCGDCNHACMLPHATQTCSDGSCGIGPCDPSWYDLDGKSSTGCEYYCASSPVEAESCADAVLSNDGKDNDCNGDVDCAFIEATFPERDQAAAAEDVFIRIKAPFAQDFTFECRSARAGTELPSTWDACPTAAGHERKVLPWTVEQSEDAANDGRWVTEVRLRYPDGRVSQPTPAFRYYLHHSLSGTNAEICEPKATDPEFFAAAKPSLVLASGTQPSFPNDHTFLANPFISVTFVPPLVSKFEWGLGGTATRVEWLSLRRRFVLDPNRELLLVTRVYTSKRGANGAFECEVGLVHKHNYDEGDVYVESRQYYNHCDAWVLNRTGAGVCLGVQSDESIRVMNPTSNAFQEYFVKYDLDSVILFPAADNLMWRKLAYNNQDLFSPKCYSDPVCETGDTVYLPDRSLFPELP